MSQAAVSVRIRRLAGNYDVPLPGYQTDGAVAMDLHAAVTGNLRLSPGEYVLVPCGFAVAIPQGHEGQIRPRSGLAAKAGITVLNSPGTIDPDYRGEVKVVLINHGKEVFTIERGSRIAQLLILPVQRTAWQEVSELPDTRRGEGGFGHTGQ